MSEPSAETTLEGEVERITFENAESGYRVIKVAIEGRKERLSVVGTFPPVAVGARLRLRGLLESDPRYGEQLRASIVTELLPTTLIGLERYLSSGLVPGVGRVTAKRIVDTFGMDTLRVLDEVSVATGAGRLAEVAGLGKKRADAIAAAWREQRAVRDVMVFLQAHGASPSLAMRIFRRYGPEAARVVSGDPYRLAVDVWGIGFKTADRIAESLGIAKDSPARMEAGVLQALRDVVEAGHCYEEVDALIVRAAELLGLAPDDGRLYEAARSLVHRGLAVAEKVRNTPIVATREIRRAEERLGSRLAAMVRQAAPKKLDAAASLVRFAERGGTALAEEQSRAVELVSEHRIVVVTGGPGVGKTTVVKAMLAMFEEARLDVKLAAPTGRAAKRMAEATGRPSQTLHRLLEFDPKTTAFKRNVDRPIEADVVVVDEASMVDLLMADALACAIGEGTRLVLVGDVDQLPSVGPGAFLRDVLATEEVPSVRLVHIFRQGRGSLIVENAHRIDRGERPIAPEAGDPAADFFIVERRDPEAALEAVVALVRDRIPKRFGLDPVRDIQVLVPMHRGGAGSSALNAALQATLNPRGPELVRGNTTFRQHDKVMQLRNDYDREVFNGDVGEVVSVDEDEGTLVVRYEAPQGTHDVSYDGAELDELTLAYACTVHKSQGSEYPAVVVAFLTHHFVMLSRNLLYTAVTRGKQLVVLVCDPRAVDVALAEERRTDRKTRLRARLAEALQKLE